MRKYRTWTRSEKLGLWTLVLMVLFGVLGAVLQMAALETTPNVSNELTVTTGQVEPKAEDLGSSGQAPVTGKNASSPAQVTITTGNQSPVVGNVKEGDVTIKYDR